MQSVAKQYLTMLYQIFTVSLKKKTDRTNLCRRLPFRDWHSLCHRALLLVVSGAFCHIQVSLWRYPWVWWKTIQEGMVSLCQPLEKKSIVIRYISYNSDLHNLFFRHHDTHVDATAIQLCLPLIEKYREILILLPSIIHYMCLFDPRNKITPPPDPQTIQVGAIYP
jgi:hypothetical protein